MNIGAFANTGVFISYRCRLTKVLADAARVEKGSKGGGGRVRLSNVDTGELSGFKDELICRFILAVDMDGPAFLEREQWDWVWMGTGRSELICMQ
jgi:hypothetical protein